LSLSSWTGGRRAPPTRRRAPHLRRPRRRNRMLACSIDSAPVEGAAAGAAAAPSTATRRTTQMTLTTTRMQMIHPPPEPPPRRRHYQHPPYRDAAWVFRGWIRRRLAAAVRVPPCLLLRRSHRLLPNRPRPSLNFCFVPASRKFETHATSRTTYVVSDLGEGKIRPDPHETYIRSWLAR
jgi:hypothetical protein